MISWAGAFPRGLKMSAQDGGQSGQGTNPSQGTKTHTHILDSLNNLKEICAMSLWSVVALLDGDILLATVSP